VSDRSNQSLWKKYKANFQKHQLSNILFLVFAVVVSGGGIHFLNEQEIITDIYWVVAGVLLAGMTLASPLLLKK
jgi:hypothetical protein